MIQVTQTYLSDDILFKNKLKPVSCGSNIDLLLFLKNKITLNNQQIPQKLLFFIV